MQASTRIIILSILVLNVCVQNVQSNARTGTTWMENNTPSRSLEQAVLEPEVQVQGSGGEVVETEGQDPAVIPSGSAQNEEQDMLQGSAGAGAGAGDESESQGKGRAGAGGDASSGGGGQVDDNDDDDDSSGLILPVLLAGLVFSAYMVRKKFLENGGGYQNTSTRWIVGNKNEDESEYNTSTLDRRQEMVPLSNEDEWAWEDNARKDLEIGPLDDDDEDLEAALDMNDLGGGNGGSSGLNIGRSSISGSFHSKGASAASVSKSYSRISAEKSKSASNSIKSSTSISTTASTVTSASLGVNGCANNNVGANNPSVPTSTTPTSMNSPVPAVSMSSKVVPPKHKKSPPMAPKSAPVRGAAPVMSVEDMLKEQSKMSGGNVITSLSMSKPTVRAKPKPSLKKKPMKKNDDDIFASMGLSSDLGKKSNNNATSAPMSALASASASAAVTSTSTSAFTAKATPAPAVSSEKEDSTGWNSGVESDWGDDGDLDDLISDDEGI